MTQHTPGPWEIADDLILGPEVDISAAVMPPDMRGMGICATAAALICTMSETDNSEANARLIAAAPDLLAALLDIVQYEDDAVAGGAQTRLSNAEYDAASAAIARATKA